MISHQKVVWAEGILLGQQHFQHWERYLQYQQQLFQQHTSPFHWGVVALDLDEAVLAQGVIRVNQCTALLHERCWLHFNSAWDGGALARTLPEAGSLKTLDVFLAIPDSEHVSGVSGYPEISRASAWSGKYYPVLDSYDPLREREVLLAKQNIQLLLEGEAMDGFRVIQIARLEFNPLQSAYRLSRHYAPAVLQVAASACLVQQLGDWIALITQHLRVLEIRKEKHRHVNNQFGYGDFIYFNLIKTLTTALVRLQALQALPQLHPINIYESFVALLSELAGYCPTPWELPSMPVYRHDALAEVFLILKQRLEEWVHRAIPVDSLDVRLFRVHETQYESEEVSQASLQDKQFCLALYHEDSPFTLAEKILAQVKVASPSRLMGIVQSFTQGVGLCYQPHPEKALMAKRHYHYFMLDKRSDGWKDIVAEGRIAFFISKSLAAHSFELICY